MQKQCQVLQLVRFICGLLESYTGVADQILANNQLSSLESAFQCLQCIPASSTTSSHAPAKVVDSVALAALTIHGHGHGCGHRRSFE